MSSTSYGRQSIRFGEPGKVVAIQRRRREEREERGRERKDMEKREREREDDKG